MLILLPILAIICAPALWLVLGRPRFLAKVGSDEEATIKVSVVIPARDEEINIGALLDSLNAQTRPAHEVIVVDDGSSDRTAEIAREKGARVISGKELPDGWNGKPWACTQGAEAATGDWYLFLDADTRLAPDALSKLVGAAWRNGGAVSVCPHHQVEQPYEELSVFFNVMMLAGVNAFGFCEEEACALFGQCLLISAEDYELVGGHESVKGKVLENFYLADQLSRCGVARECYVGLRAVWMRMFPEGFDQLYSSWMKGFAAGAGHAAARAIVFSSIWLTGAMLAMVGLFIAPFVGVTCAALCVTTYLLYVGQCLWVFRLAGSFSQWNAWLFPISLLFYQWTFFSALRAHKQGRKVKWKGREVG
ncbi:glycosyltransferase [Sulfuriroseicoccus oceanibius]|uniref:Glycosyltransferase n=1 Tax=Sulfuriroseicoccus oceanibius TaxID=2707525 RepID=A0A6B3LAJ2_9BACT|nr:glycosyltransferase family A protein [Sulfuriroseicoccus oceanibius]QQL46050.1 glycosyltransferase [Sulfuriroseicoccus oceanibius]